MAVAAAIDVPASKMLRRLSTLSSDDFELFDPFSLLPPGILLSCFTMKTEKLFHDEIPPHAAKSEMACGCIDRFGMPRCRSIAAAIVRRAQMRAALDHLAGDRHVGLAGIVATLLAPPARVLGNAARLRRIGLMPGCVPVRRPFPDIADHVVQAVAVGREGFHRRGALVAILIEILEWKFALPGVGHMRTAGREFVAPCELGTIEPAA